MKDDGGILVLMAITLPIILLIASGSYMIFSFATATEQIEASAKMALLAAAESYLAKSCATDKGGPGFNESVRDACHVHKLRAAAERANEIRERNESFLGDMVIGSEDIGLSQGDFQAELLAHYYHGDIPPPGTQNRDQIINDCKMAAGVTSGEEAFPCLLERSMGSNGSIADAFSLSGTVTENKILSAIHGIFGFVFGNKYKSFFLKVRAVPMRMCAIIDLSRSTTYNTHPRNNNPEYLSSYPLDGDGTILERVNGEAYDGFVNSWNAIGDERDGDIPTLEPVPRYKDDYGLIETYEDDLISYQQFESQYPQYAKNHTEPEGDVAPDTYNSPSVSYKHLVDFYRHPESALIGGDIQYDGPEPWISIIEGVRRATKYFRDRAVAGDRACLIFFNDTLNWRGVINLTDDFDYIDKVLDAGHIRDPDHYNEVDIYSGTLPVAPGTGQWSKDLDCDVESPSCMPLWARLGLFPISGTFTNAPLAIAEALRQFEEDDSKTTSADFIAHFGDGLTSCYQDSSGGSACDSSQHFFYLQSMKQIERMVTLGMHKNNIAFHNFLIGNHVRPHTVLLANPNNGNKCYTDAEMRKQMPPKEFVQGQNYDARTMNGIATPESQAAFETEPFYQVNSDWYNLVRMTGGIWAPLRDMHPDCSLNIKPVIACDSTPTRLEFDPDCLTISEQVFKYLDQALKSSSGFTVVE